MNDYLNTYASSYPHTYINTDCMHWSNFWNEVQTMASFFNRSGRHSFFFSSLFSIFITLYSNSESLDLAILTSPFQLCLMSVGARNRPIKEAFGSLRLRSPRSLALRKSGWMEKCRNKMNRFPKNVELRNSLGGKQENFIVNASNYWTDVTPIETAVYLQWQRFSLEIRFEKFRVSTVP
jgi:hypothetical protein